MTNKPKTAAEHGFMQGSPPPDDKRVTLQNWYVGDPVRWSFKHMEQLVPCAFAHRGYEGVSEFSAENHLPTEKIETIPLTHPNGSAITIADWMAETCTDGLLILQKGNVIYEQYPDMQPHQRHLLQSVSKSLTACLAAVFIECGDLDANQTIAHYLPDYAKSGYGDATVQQVLDMTASIDYDETYDDMLSDVNLHTIAGGWYGHKDRVGPYADLPMSLYGYLPTLQHNPDRKHGEMFEYISANTDVLGILLETIGGKPFTELFGEHIWSQLGAQEDAAMTVDSLGCVFPCGGFCVTLRDLARFGQMVIQNGFFNGRQIVPAAFFEDTRQNADRTAWQRNPERLAQNPEGGYRNQFWLTGNEDGAFFCAGIHGQHVYINPAKEIVIVKLSTYPIAWEEEIAQLSSAGFEAICSSF